MAITFDGQNDRITTSSQGLTVPSNVAGTFQAGGLAIGAGSTILTSTLGGNIGIGTINPLGKLHLSARSGGDAVIVLDDTNRNAVLYAPGSGSSGGEYYFRRGVPGSYTDRLIIDTNGNVRKPLQSFCDTGDTTSYNAAQSLTVSPASAKGNWSSTTANVGNNFSTTTDLYTCPSTGIYAISCTCSMDNVTPVPARTIFVLSINGGYEEITEIFDTWENQSPCVLRALNANDTIGLGINGTGGSNYHVRLQVYFLG